jgi:signal transduction histidine kinase
MELHLHRFHIEDNGLGIAPAEREKIFDPLTRLHGSEIPGCGLGLAICRSIVQRHNGQLSVTSVVGAGSVFTMDLPLNPDCLNSSASPASADAGLEERKSALT